MIINVYVKTKARENNIEPISEGEYKISTTALPVNNRANNSIINLLSEYFGAPKNNIKIIKGLTAKTKTISILLND